MNIDDWLLLVLWFTFIKSILIGSEFNFVHWLRYGNRYWSWYFNRPGFTL